MDAETFKTRSLGRASEAMKNVRHDMQLYGVTTNGMLSHLEAELSELDELPEFEAAKKLVASQLALMGLALLGAESAEKGVRCP